MVACKDVFVRRMLDCLCFRKYRIMFRDIGWLKLSYSMPYNLWFVFFVCSIDNIQYLPMACTNLPENSIFICRAITQVRIGYCYFGGKIQRDSTERLSLSLCHLLSLIRCIFTFQFITMCGYRSVIWIWKCSSSLTHASSILNRIKTHLRRYNMHVVHVLSRLHDTYCSIYSVPPWAFPFICRYSSSYFRKSKWNHISANTQNWRVRC